MVVTVVVVGALQPVSSCLIFLCPWQVVVLQVDYALFCARRHGHGIWVGRLTKATLPS